MDRAKYLFLDFDGVLNSGNNYNRLLRSGAPTGDAWGTLFDARCVGRLARIVERTGARIVVTSTWRYLYPLAELRNMWRERGLPGQVCDTLPTDMAPPGTKATLRGMEIEEWFRRRGEPAERENAGRKYAILDDEPGFLPHQLPHLITTDPDTGLSDHNAEQAIALLA